MQGPRVGSSLRAILRSVKGCMAQGTRLYGTRHEALYLIEVREPLPAQILHNVSQNATQIYCSGSN